MLERTTEIGPPIGHPSTCLINLSSAKKWGGFLDSSIQSDDEKIKIDGYTLIRADHPSDSKKNGVCIYYKEHIPLIKRDDLCTLNNCLVTEIRSQNEKCFLTCIYRSPSQSRDEFENFCLKFDLLLNKLNDEFPFCSIITGDFNARCSR